MPHTTSPADPRTRRDRRLLGGTSTVVTAVAVVGAAVTLTVTFGGTSSTTPLDGESALPAQIVAGRVISRYHPLPWLGHDVDSITCGSDLDARVGATTECRLKDGDGRVDTVAVHVTAVDATSVTWTFDR